MKRVLIAMKPTLTLLATLLLAPLASLHAADLGVVNGDFSDLSGLTLAAEETVTYEDVVRNMDTVRKTIPAVLLGGF